MAGPFHHDLGRDAGGQCEADEAAAAGVRADLCPLGEHLGFAAAIAVAGFGDRLVEAAQLAEILQVLVHLLVGDDGQHVVARQVGIFGQDGLRHGVEVDVQAVVGLLGGEVHHVAIDVGAAELGHVGVAKACEGAEAEHVAGLLKGAGFLNGFLVFVAFMVLEFDFGAVLGNLVFVQGEEFFVVQEDDGLFGQLELGFVGLDGDFAGVAFADGPVDEPEEVLVLLPDRVFLQAGGFAEVEDKAVESVAVEVFEVLGFFEPDYVVFEGPDHAKRRFGPGVGDGAFLNEFFNVLLQGSGLGGRLLPVGSGVFARAATALDLLDCDLCFFLGDCRGIFFVDGQLELDAEGLFAGLVVGLQFVVGEVGLEVEDALVDVAPVLAFGVDVAGGDFIGRLVPLVGEDGEANGLLQARAAYGNGCTDGFFSGFVDIFCQIKLNFHIVCYPPVFQFVSFRVG